MTDYLIYFRDGTAYRDIFKDVRSARKNAVKLLKTGMNVHKISPITRGHSHAQYIVENCRKNGIYTVSITVWNPQRREYSLHTLHEDGTLSKY